VNTLSEFYGTILASGTVKSQWERGRKRARAKEDFDGSVVTANAFGYNSRSEVTEAEMGTNTYAYAYDPIGHQKSAKPKAQPPGDRDFEAVRQHGARGGIPRRSGNRNRLSASADGDMTAYAANRLNQYAAVTNSANSASPRETLFSYDADGNMLTNGPWAYTWDAENRLASVMSNSVLMVTNVYDHIGRRIKKVSRGGAESAEFLYDGWNVIREVRSQNSGVSTNYYTWGMDLSGTQQGAGGVGGLLSVTTVGPNSPTVYYPTYDANGNITRVKGVVI
jgi:hypothetical protein